MFLHTTDGKRFYFGEIQIQKITCGEIESDGQRFIEIFCTSKFVPVNQNYTDGVLCFRVSKEEAERFLGFSEFKKGQ